MSSVKPSKPESEYFARVEAEKKRKIAVEHHKALNQEQRTRLKELHWMHCPKCGMHLHEVVFRGVTVEKCFICHGVYIGESELEKIAGREDGFMPALLSLFKT